MNWTDRQLETIETRDKNILVAAAAGSGKTAVLVERIRRMAMEEKIPLDSMLIVTFTKAAAAEMKEKIRRALKDRLEEDPAVREQLERLSRAQISTFHAFSLDVVRHFFFLTDLEPDISICDETAGKLMKEEALDDLFREAFAREDEGFYTLLDWYGNEKNDGKVREIIKSLYNTIMALPAPFETLAEKVRELSDYEHSTGWVYRGQIITDKLRRAAAAADSALHMLEEAGLNRLAEKYREEWADYQRMTRLAESGRYGEIAGILEDFPSMQMRGRGEEKDILAEIKDAIAARRKVAKTLRDEVKAGFLEDTVCQLEEAAALAPVARTLARLLEEFHNRFREKKQERKQVDFNDIEHYCLEILKDADARKYYREKFRYIFVDEYQDTSVMQETIIDAIAGDRNLFMVGDIKQSIYKFRLAEPEIFRARYERYGSAGAPAGSGVDPGTPAEPVIPADPGTPATSPDLRIDLNQNFRSKPVILDWINHRFEPMMEGYDEAARLYPGLPCEEEFSFRPEIRLLDTDGQEESPDETVRDMQKDELEAHLVADILRENLGKPFYDSKENRVRPMEYRHMAVLLRSVAGPGPVYQDVLQQRGIPVYIDNNKGYYDTLEVNIMMNLLSVIDNRFRDVPLLSVLRSEIFGFSTEELADIRLLQPKGSYAEAFAAVAAESDDAAESNKALCTRARAVLDTLARWRDLAGTMPLPDYVWMLLQESGYYLLAGAMPRGDLRQANLRRLVDLTAEFAGSGQASLYGFVKYIESVRRDKNVDIGQVKLLSEKDDVVRVMTIHKSKGLEFPLVIVAGIGKHLQYTDSSQKVRFHKDLGLGMFLEDPANHLEKKTLPFRLVMEKLREEEREEQKRVLYVAMTRARDRLYLTGTADKPAELLEAKEAGEVKDTSFLSMMPSVEDVRILTPEELGAGSHEAAAATVPEEPGDPGALAALVRQRLSYEYPFRSAAKIRSRYSVSALNAEAHRPVAVMEAEGDDAGQGNSDLTGGSGLAGGPGLTGSPGLTGGPGSPDLLAEIPDEPEEQTLPVPLFLAPEQKLSGAERGTVYHRVMEYIDFPAVAAGGGPEIERAIERMVADEILLPAEAEAVDSARIRQFFDTPLGKRCVAAAERGRLYREQSFVLAMERAGEATGVQGVIDVFFREGEQIVLLDYKTNRVDLARPFEEEAARIADMYREQQALYARALEKATDMPVGEKWLYLFAAGREILL